MKPISLFQPYSGPEEIAAVTRVLSGSWWGRGPEVAAFEAEFCEFTGWRYCVTMNSCTAALQIAVRCLDLQPASEIGVPTMTFCSDAHVVAQEGHNIHWMDCDHEGQAMLPLEWPKHMRAAIAVHFGGRPMALEHWKNALRVPIIEDCAHSLGSNQKPQGWCACYSFHAVKSLAAGDGGALCTNDPALADRARRLAWLGIDRGTSERTTQAGYQPGYEINEIGYKCHWNDLLASIGRVQLKRVKEATVRRWGISRRYHRNLASLSEDYARRPTPCNDSAWHIYPIAATRRDELAQYLTKQGIHTGVHYRPVHTFACYKSADTCPRAEARYAETLSLPCHARMTLADCDRVSEAVLKFYQEG